MVKWNKEIKDFIRQEREKGKTSNEIRQEVKEKFNIELTDGQLNGLIWRLNNKNKKHQTETEQETEEDFLNEASNIKGKQDFTVLEVSQEEQEEETPQELAKKKKKLAKLLTETEARLIGAMTKEKLDKEDYDLLSLGYELLVEENVKSLENVGKWASWGIFGLTQLAIFLKYKDKIAKKKEEKQETKQEIQEVKEVKQEDIVPGRDFPLPP
jgi:hypothetical protein